MACYTRTSICFSEDFVGIEFLMHLLQAGYYHFRQQDSTANVVEHLFLIEEYHHDCPVPVKRGGDVICDAEGLQSRRVTRSKSKLIITRNTINSHHILIEDLVDTRTR